MHFVLTFTFTSPFVFLITWRDSQLKLNVFKFKIATYTRKQHYKKYTYKSNNESLEYVVKIEDSG